MPANDRPEWMPLAPAADPEIPLEELEERLEMQQLPLMDPALLCYTDLCSQDCAADCPAGYTGCTDKCLCDGVKCTIECGTLCTVDSCVVDF